LRFSEIVFFNWIAKFQEIAVLEGQIAFLTHYTKSSSVVASFGIKDFNPGTHILGPDPVSAYFCLYLYFNALQSSRDLVFMGLKFIEDFIFLVKKNFFDQILKVSFTEKF